MKSADAYVYLVPYGYGYILYVCFNTVFVPTKLCKCFFSSAVNELAPSVLYLEYSSEISSKIMQQEALVRSCEDERKKNPIRSSLANHHFSKGHTH